MKKIAVTLIAGLFASAAFAQSAAPAAPSSTTPDSAVPPAVAKAQATHEKEAAKAGKGERKDARHPKKHAPVKTDPNAPADAQGATVGPTGSGASPTTGK